MATFKMVLGECQIPTQASKMRRGVVRLTKCAKQAVTKVQATSTVNIPGLISVRAGEPVQVCSQHAMFAQYVTFGG